MTETMKAPQQASRPITQHEEHALLTDGTTVRIRPVLPSDHERVLALYEVMSPENLRLRFFTTNRRLAERSADRLCASAVPGPRALLAESDEALVDLAEYERFDYDRDEVWASLAPDEARCIAGLLLFQAEAVEPRPPNPAGHAEGGSDIRRLLPNITARTCTDCRSAPCGRWPTIRLPRQWNFSANTGPGFQHGALKPQASVPSPDKGHSDHRAGEPYE
ncbi:hypothetical protein [Streptomyces sp. NBC_01794]|uniref:hypothetical protein n=1 Tax=Streptomyces sp. NBC_01794 TaxID=2975942 RepID=UPI003087ABB0|nr:hypothetical protein OIE54_37375 [Streptomyces sp. NBC_01794]